MMEIKLFVSAHRPFPVPEHPLLTPVQAGAALGRPLPGFLRDDTGENISALNRAYCELSVLMGTRYRSAQTDALERSVNSILEQSFRDFELLVCDDGSCGEASRLLERMAAADGRIKLVRPGDALLLPRKLNACLREARGRYIARMDDDDRSHPERFARQLAFLKARPEFAFVGSDANLYRGGSPVGRRRLPAVPTVRDFYMTQPYLHPALMFRREALEAVNGYSEDKRCVLCEDYDLLLRLYAGGYRGANLGEPLLDYTLPATARGNRRMGHRWNETVTRWRRFKELGVLPGALPYVVKPLAVGLLPERVLARLKEGRDTQEDGNYGSSADTDHRGPDL